MVVMVHLEILTRRVRLRYLPSVDYVNAVKALLSNYRAL